MRPLAHSTFAFGNASLMLRVGLPLLLAMLTSVPAQAQTSIYSEDFNSYADGTTQPGDGSWSRDISNADLSGDDHFDVQSQHFEGVNLDGEAVWETKQIDISGHASVGFSLEAIEEGDHESTDYFDVAYRIDGGPFTLIANWNGNGSATHTLAGDQPDDNDWQSETITKDGLSGSTLTIRVIMKNNAQEETLALDDVSVTAMSGDTRVQFSTASDATPEGDSGTSTYDVAVAIINTSSTSATTADVAATGGSADGTDYSYSTQTVEFSAGSSADQTVQVPLNGDTDAESDEAITFALQNVSGGDNAAAGTPDQFTLTIENDDTPDLVINELHADPADDISGDANGDGTRDGSDDEFVEIVNTSDAAFDLSGYKITDEADNTYAFPDGTALSPGQPATIFGGDSPTGIEGFVDTGLPGLNNGGDTVTLSDASGTVIASVGYGDSGNAPDADENQSITRDPELTGSFAPHSDVSGSGGSLFSPGTKVDGNSFEGTVSVQMNGPAGWRMVATPVDGVTVADLAGQNLVQGISGSSYPDAEANIYDGYDGASFTKPDFSDALPSGKGVIWYLYEDAKTGETDPLPFTLKVTGAAPSGDVQVTSLATGQDFHLLGNPYGSSFDLSGLNLTEQGFSANVQIWNPNAGSAGSYQVVTRNNSDSDDLVAAGQGFFVERSSGSNEMLTFSGDERATGAPFFGKRPDSAAAPARRLLSLRLVGRAESGAEITRDEAVRLFFHEDATTDWDAWDASKLPSLADPYATLAFRGTRDDAPVLKAQEARPLTPGARLTLPLAFQTSQPSGTFTLTWPALENIPDAWQLTLTDRADDTTVNLQQDASYTFTRNAAGKTEASPENRRSVPSARRLEADAATPRFLLTVDATSSVAVHEPTASVPERVRLKPNYPNPFNPQTTIRYGVPAQAGRVELAVYDVLGRRVATLASGPQSPGWHTVTWEATSQSSGVYFLRVAAGGIVRTQKMLLVK